MDTDDDPRAAEHAVHAQIEALGIDCERMPCDPDLADTAAFCAHYGVDIQDSANAILVVGKATPPTYALCLLLADSRLDVNHAVRRAIGAKRASFASADQTRAITGQLIGGVSAFGMPPDLPIYIDARVMDRPRIVVGGGSRSLKLRLAPGELRKLPAARVVQGLARPVTPSGE